MIALGHHTGERQLVECPIRHGCKSLRAITVVGIGRVNAAAELRFEEAAYLRDRIRELMA